jgi:hypothetical protein
MWSQHRRTLDDSATLSVRRDPEVYSGWAGSVNSTTYPGRDEDTAEARRFTLTSIPPRLRKGRNDRTGNGFWGKGVAGLAGQRLWHSFARIERGAFIEQTGSVNHGV